jgi:hypothetical protein
MINTTQINGEQYTSQEIEKETIAYNLIEASDCLSDCLALIRQNEKPLRVVLE